MARELSYPQRRVYFGEALGETHVGDTPGVGIRQLSGELSYAHEGLNFREALGETHGPCPIRQFCAVRPFIIFNSGGGIVVWAPDPPRGAHTTCQPTWYQHCTGAPLPNGWVSSASSPFAKPLRPSYAYAVRRPFVTPQWDFNVVPPRLSARSASSHLPHRCVLATRMRCDELSSRRSGILTSSPPF